MKHLTLLAAGIMALLVAGCAGNGHDSTTTPGVTTGTPRIEAVVLVERTNLKNPSMYSDEELRDPQVVNPTDLIVPTVYGVQDTSNFQARESYVFQLVGYTSAGKRVILPASFSSADTLFTHGVVGDSGLYFASDVPTGEPVGVTATYDGHAYFTTYSLKERQVRYIGKVTLGGKAYEGAKITFLDDSGLPTGSTTSGYDGSFRASLPLRTTQFTVDPHSIPTGYTGFTFDGGSYIAGDPTSRPAVAFDALTTVDASGFPIEIVN